ncbi:alanine racemase [Parvibaculum indicum]|uniref:alanine racemase n=1 Tax=Parvibaculum indicum TaxID=562969 RepID=UPI00141F159F|nr:alanine racemase [Parvibaculum indicum]NIJ43094.1 alanine racemase [Parvibaculum indicum]
MRTKPSAPAPADAPFEADAGGVLTIDLDALAANYRRFQDTAPHAEVGAVVKANAYGLGLRPVAAALAEAGCGSFFVAEAAEGRAVREALKGRADDATIYVLNGLMPGAAPVFIEYGLRPCLSSLAEIEEWKAATHLPCAIHFDTGMNRLGLSPGETARFMADNDWSGGLDVALLMSHLACADDPAHALNATQRERFAHIVETLQPRFPRAVASLANSGGAFLGTDYHFDLIRPGIGLYGGNPFAARDNPFETVATAHARVLQVKEVPAGESTGYGASSTAEGVRRIAVLAAGYADGYFRSLSFPSLPDLRAQGGMVALAGRIVPVAGRVSMDLIVADITSLPEGAVSRGDMAELIGPAVPLDEVARRAGTLGYEVLTSLGERYRRHYTRGGRIPSGVAGNNKGRSVS